MRRVWLAFIVVALSACSADPVANSPLRTFPLPPTTQATQAPIPTTSRAGPAVEILIFAKDAPLVGRSRIDIYGPQKDGVLPVIIAIHDLDQRSTIQPLIDQLSEQAIVLVPTYDGPTRGGRFPDPLTATACALGLASTAADYGGDPAQVTLVGHGFGALAAYIVASSGTLYQAPDCHVQTMVSVERIVAIDGTWDAERLAEESPGAMSVFMGGSPTESPAIWDLLSLPDDIDNDSYAVTLLYGLADESSSSEWAAEYFRQTGALVDVVSIAGRSVAALVERPDEVASSILPTPTR